MTGHDNPGCNVNDEGAISRKDNQNNNSMPSDGPTVGHPSDEQTFDITSDIIVVGILENYFSVII